jgi:hypothetical protein
VCNISGYYQKHRLEPTSWEWGTRTTVMSERY